MDVTFTGLILKKFAKSSIDTQSPTDRGVGIAKLKPPGVFWESVVYFWLVANVYGPETNVHLAFASSNPPGVDQS